jgi:hypothetical protein
MEHLGSSIFSCESTSAVFQAIHRLSRNREDFDESDLFSTTDHNVWDDPEDFSALGGTAWQPQSTEFQDI